MNMQRPAFGHPRNQLGYRPAVQPVTLNAEAIAIGDSQKCLKPRARRLKPKKASAMGTAFGDALGAMMPESTFGKVATGGVVLVLTGWLLSASAKTRR